MIKNYIGKHRDSLPFCKIMVVGARGYIGAEVVRMLLSAGHQVYVPTRRACASTPNHANLHPYAYDGSTVDMFERLAAEVDLVVNCAGETRNPELFQVANVLFPGEMSDICRDRDLKLIDLSSLGVFSGYTDGTIDKNTPLNPVGAYEESKSRYLSRLIAEGIDSQRHLVLMPSAVIGGQKGLGWKNATIVVLGYIGVGFKGKAGGSVGLHFCHIRDICAVVLQALENFEGGILILNETIHTDQIARIHNIININLYLIGRYLTFIRTSKIYRILIDTRTFNSDVDMKHTQERFQ